MEPHEYLLSLRKHWIVILATTLLGVVGAYALDHVITTSYQAHSVVFVSASQGSTTSELVQGSTFTQNLVQSYAQLVSTPLVLQPVVDNLGLHVTASELAGSVSADAPLNTVLIDITVNSPNAKSAALIANSVADSLATVAEQLSPSTTDNKPAITMSVVTPAHTPSSPSAPNSQLIFISGLLIGLLLGAAYAVLRELLDTRIRGDRDIMRVTGLPILGTISRDPAKGIALLRDRQGRVAEDFRRVRINLEFVALDRQIRSVVVTSGLPAEGKTTVSLNLALALAEREKRVLLIDADLRRPAVHRYAQIDGTVGLTSVLLGNISLADAVQSWGSGAIDVLPSGLIPPNPEQLLASDPMIRVLALAAETYDVVVIDSPPVLPVADTLSLSRLVDGVLVVARFGATRRPALSRTLESLESIHGPVAGIVLNSVKTRRSANMYYGYGSEQEFGLAGAAIADPTIEDAIDAAEPPEARAQKSPGDADHGQDPRGFDGDVSGERNEHGHAADGLGSDEVDPELEVSPVAAQSIPPNPERASKLSSAERRRIARLSRRQAAAGRELEWTGDLRTAQLTSEADRDVGDAPVLA